jgi:hypothetical protein
LAEEEAPPMIATHVKALGASAEAIAQHYDLAFP